MSQTRPVFSLEDFPDEIIERFVPDNRPKTISALKLVSKRFYDFFSNDFYYRSYLHYPEKYYLCEMRCGKNRGKEVVEDIKSGAVGKWKGYLTLENLHLENWRSGRIAHCEIVSLPNLNEDIIEEFNFDFIIWHDLIDEDNEHWLLNLRDDGTIVLINITDEPKMFVKREMYGLTIECVRLLCGQVICISFKMRHILVLNIVKGGDISLQYNFDFGFDFRYFRWIVASGKCETTLSQRNLFVSFRVYPNVDGLLHFRDLKTGNPLEDVCLWDYEFLKRFRNLACDKLIFQFHENVEFPNIMMTIVDNEIGTELLVVFNIEKMQATAFIDMSEDNVTECCIICNVAYIFSSTYDDEEGVTFVGVHRLPLENHPKIDYLQTPEFVCQFYCRGVFDGTVSKHQKIAFKDHTDINKVHILSVGESEFSNVEVTLDSDGDHKILEVIGPDVLIIENYGLNPNIICFKVTEKEEGYVAEEVIDWKKILSDNKAQFSDPCPILSSMDLSKLVFYDETEKGRNSLAIFRF